MRIGGINSNQYYLSCPFFIVMFRSGKTQGAGEPFRTRLRREDISPIAEAEQGDSASAVGVDGCVM
jgi:hypothetical protein